MNNEELERRIALLTAENEELRQKVSGVDQESIWQMENENDKLKELLAASYAALHTAVNVYREECCGDSLCGICAYDLPAGAEYAECPGFYKNECFRWQFADDVEKLIPIKEESV